MNSFNFPKQKNKSITTLVKNKNTVNEAENKDVIKSVKFITVENEINNEIDDKNNQNEIDECKSISEKCLLECVKIQNITAGNKNESWKKRSTIILKSFWSEFQKVCTYTMF